MQYNINGQVVQTDGPLSEGDIDHIAGQLGSPQPSAADDASIAGEAAKGLDSAINATLYAPVAAGQAAVRGLKKLFPNNFDTNGFDEDQQAFRQAQAKDAPAVPSVTDINSPHAAALYAARALGGAAPALAAGGAGVVPAAVAGGAQGFGDTYGQTGDVGAAAASAALNAGVAGLRVPFMQEGKSVLGGAARGALGGVALAPAQAVAGTIPNAIASGNPDDAIPSATQLADAAASGAIVGGVGGAAMHAANGDPLVARANAPQPNPVADAARARVAQRLQAEANSQGYSLTDTDSAGQTARVLNNVHNDLAEEIKANANTLSDQLDPQLATSPDDRDARIQAQATLRDARNKVKSTASPDDIANLNALVGHTAEGQQLIDAVHESNVLTDLTNGGLKGGISQYTDAASPLRILGGGGHGFAERLAHGGGIGALGLGILAHEPTIAATGLGAAVAGRLIDKATGNRYPVNKFVQDNIGKYQPRDYSQYPSVNDAAATKAAFDAAEAQRTAQREQQLRTQRMMNNNPGLGGYDNLIYSKTGIRPHEAMQGVITLARTGQITPEEAQAYFRDPKGLMGGNVGNHVIDMLDDLAEKGQLSRDPNWQPDASSRVVPTQSEKYAAQARGNQERVSDAMDAVRDEGLDPRWEQAINETIADIGGTNNKVAARAASDKLMSILPDDATRATAGKYIEPLIKQIRHATPEAATNAKAPQPLVTKALQRDSSGRPIQRQPLNLNATDLIQRAMQGHGAPAGPSVSAPGQGVQEGTANGFEPALRVKLSGAEVPEKPLITIATNNKNAAKQLANLDTVLNKFPDADSSPARFSEMMGYALGTDEPPVPPYNFLRMMQQPDRVVQQLSKLSRGQIADADHGFQQAAEFKQLYASGNATPTTTARLFLWSFLSRGVSPYTQEGLFLDAVKGIDPWVQTALKGNFDPSQRINIDGTPMNFEEWAKSVAPKGSGQPGAGATHNLNAFGQLFLKKMSATDPETSNTYLQKLHDLFADQSLSGPQIRREFLKFGEGVGIDNKVVSFTLLVSGRPDVMVLDRVQMRNLWNDGRFNDRSLYDPETDENAKQVPGSSLAELTYGVRGLMVYEAIERGLQKIVPDIYAKLGRPQDASIGRFHWDTWVAASDQEASHGTISGILNEAKGINSPYSGITAKEGRFDTFGYGAQYGRNGDNEPYFRYPLPHNSGSVDFDTNAFRSFLDDIKNPKSGVVPKGFKVTEDASVPWYLRPGVNTSRLIELARKHSSD